ncbi:homeobox protein NANOG-like [Saccopteryx leptura]|uniref:homeobox protein NANOG-like n=1 Tax=Saccopteryx leptura TaxID=249018 RepID=UPI00339D20D8
MSVGSACPQNGLCPGAFNSRESSPVPKIYEPGENYASLGISAEKRRTETVSPLPPSMDLLIQNSPDSSTSPDVIPPTSVDRGTVKEKVQVKKQKIRTVFSQTQLSVLNERFQRQKYLSFQQMQELSNTLNLSYKQIKTWFQNQRMKCKRWQKYNWSKNSNRVAQVSSATTEYQSLSSCHQRYLVNASGNFSMWSNQTCSNLAWSNHSWNSPSWNYHSWNNQTWCPQAWNNQFYSFGEESLQPQIQFQQNLVSDLEVSLETARESYDVILQTPKCYCSAHQTVDLFPDYSMNTQPGSMNIQP